MLKNALTKIYNELIKMESIAKKKKQRISLIMCHHFFYGRQNHKIYLEKIHLPIVHTEFSLLKMLMVTSTSETTHHTS